MQKTLRKIAIAALTATALAVSPSTQAATQTWDGAASGVWDTSALNWGGAAWTNTNDALFTGTPTNNVTTATGLTIGKITLDNTFTGSVTLTGGNTVNGATTINGGTLNLNSNTGLGGSAVAIGSSGTVNVTANGNVSNLFTGTGTLTVSGSTGTPNFNNVSALNGFTGTLNVNTSGAQKVALTTAGGKIGSGATVNITSGGTLYIANTATSFDGVTFNVVGSGNTENLGAIRIEANSVIGATSSVVLGGNTTLGANASTGIINAAISETTASNLTKVGTGTLVLGGANTYTGTTTISGGTLQIGNGGTSGTLSSGAVTNNATLAFNRSDNITVNNNISGSGALTKAGAGTLTLTGTNTNSGTTTIQDGTLNVGNGTSGTLGTGALTFNTNGGKINFNEAAGSSQSMGALTFGGGQGTVQSTYGGSGTSTLTFSSLAARTAGATGNFVSSGGVNGTSNIINFTSAPTAGALIDKGLFFNGGSYATYDSGGFVRDYQTTDTNAASSGAGTSTIANTSTNNVFLTGADTDQTTATVNTINMGSTGTIALATGNTLSTNGILVSGNTAATISGGTSLSSAAAGSELVVRTDLSTDNLDISTQIVNNTSASALTKAGAGTLTLSGTGNAYTGATTVNEGTLSLSGTLTGGGAINIKSGATFSETGTGVISGNSSLTSAGTTTLAGANTYTGTTTVSGGTLTVSGSGKLGATTAALTLSGGSLDLGTTSQTVGNVTISAAAASGNTIQNGSLTGNSLAVSNTTGNVIVAANFTTAGALTKTNAGAMTLSGTNSITNNLTMSAGALDVTGATTINGGANNNQGFMNVGGGSSVTVSSGGSLSILGSTGTTPGSFIGQNSSGTLTVNGGSFTIGPNNNVGIGNNNVGAIGTLNINSGTATITAGSATVGNTLNFIALGRDNATGIINLNGGTLETSRQFVRDGAGGGTVGAGTAIVNFNGGTLKALADQTSGNGWFETATTGNNQVVTTIVKSGGAKIDTNGFNTNINTVLAHDSALGATPDGGLTKSGTGTLALGGANTYTGGTTVNAGTLSVGNNSALGTGGVAVNNGGTLLIQAGFNVSNAVTLSGGAYNKDINSGTSYAYVSTSSFVGGQADTTASLVAGTTGAARSLSTSFADTSAAGNDGIRTSDVFNLSGTGTDLFALQLQIASIPANSILGWNDAGTWVNSVDGNTGNNALLVQQGYLGSFSSFQTTYGTDLSTYVGAYGIDTSANTVWAVLNHNSEFAVTAVPEPSTYALLGVGLAGLIWLRRRARSSSASS